MVGPSLVKVGKWSWTSKLLETRDKKPGSEDGSGFLGQLLFGWLSSSGHHPPALLGACSRPLTGGCRGWWSLSSKQIGRLLGYLCFEYPGSCCQHHLEVAEGPSLVKARKWQIGSSGLYGLSGLGVPLVS